ncbi:MAG TPA: hypothetical protein VJL83_00360 [Patescibacteria group bacterium]|nr:hypothetical protein [Patescibacteria group bacterium]
MSVEHSESSPNRPTLELTADGGVVKQYALGGNPEEVYSIKAKINPDGVPELIFSINEMTLPLDDILEKIG